MKNKALASTLTSDIMAALNNNKKGNNADMSRSNNQNERLRNDALRTL